MNGNIEELITAVYDMIQDAKSVPLSADKCIIERDRALDMLDELSAQLPGELKQAQTIVMSREEVVSQARREAEALIRSARQQADEMVKQEAIYQEAKRQCEQMVLETQNRMNQIKQASTEYVTGSLVQAEEAIVKALNELRDTKSRFQALSGAQAPQAPVAAAVQQPSVNFASFDQDLD
jgi:cell division septum initiation protein DivIVA